MKKIHWFNHHPKTAYIVITIFGVIIGDLVIATGYRLIFKHGFSERGWYLHKKTEQIYRSRSEKFHHGLAPNVSVPNSGWGHLKYHFFSNSLGFKDKTVRKVQRLPEGDRIVFIGDSFVEGIGLPYQKTFVGLIDSSLAKKGIEVLNAAVTSYAPSIYWRKIKWLIEDEKVKFNELVVYLDLSDVMDESLNYFLDKNENIQMQGDDLTYGFKPEESLQKWLVKEYSILLPAIFRLISDTDSKYPKHAINNERSDWTLANRQSDYPISPGVDKMELYMDKLNNLMIDHNIKLTVAVYPWPDQIYYNDLNSIHVKYWKSWCTKKKVKFINYFPYFIKMGSFSENEKTLEKLFIAGDPHWNIAGHRLIASVFLKNYLVGDINLGAQIKKNE